ncbi:MAG: hypothetical protein QXD77_00895 [Candidatus Aenigmatarchaeota archaeon]
MDKVPSNEELRVLNDLYDDLQEGLDYAKAGDLEAARRIYETVAPLAKRHLNNIDIKRAYDDLRNATDPNGPLALMLAMDNIEKKKE